MENGKWLYGSRREQSLVEYEVFGDFTIPEGSNKKEPKSRKVKGKLKYTDKPEGLEQQLTADESAVGKKVKTFNPEGVEHEGRNARNEIANIISESGCQ